MDGKPEVDGDLGINAATAAISTQSRSNSSLYPRARSFDRQLSFDIIRDDILVTLCSYPGTLGHIWYGQGAILIKDTEKFVNRQWRG